MSKSRHYFASTPRFRKPRPIIFCRKRVSFTLLLKLSAFGVLAFIVNNLFGILHLKNDSGDEGLWRNNLFLQSAGVAVKESKCQQPLIELDNMYIIKYLYKVERITCEGAEKDWVVNNGTHAFLTQESKDKFGQVICKFIELERVNDSFTKQSGKITVGEYFKFETSDFIQVQCSESRQGKTWESFFASPRLNGIVDSPYGDPEEPHNKLSVLIWGMDSISRNMFLRKLPLTYEYMMREMDGITLEGYNIVGDGTPQALIPILTGKTERELPEARKSRLDSQPVDTYPFVWKEYKDNGYLTGFIEDQPHIGTFQFRLKGFTDVPTDFYMRPYFIASQPHFEKYKKYCTGSIPRHKIVMNYIKQIFLQESNTPKFVFSFLNELSHGDVNPVEGADEDLKEFISDLYFKNILNQTVLIMMSDHGQRFGAFRATLQGKQEERKPMVTFIFPKWFGSAYPKAYLNFKLNSNRLSTPFDFHEILVDILNFSERPEAYFQEMNSLQARGMSLFKEVPIGRSCEDAKIEPHWCACLQWNTLKTNETIIRHIAKEFVAFLNSLTSFHTNICERLRLNHVISAASSYPKKELLQFKKTKDVDGFIPDLTDFTAVTTTVVQLKIETVPGKAMYEVSLPYNIRTRSFKFKITDISRINQYGSQANCLSDKEDHLRKYCFCK